MNQPDEPRIYIIGAGISGLVAAINLEKQGYKPIIIEKDAAVGGRVQTDIVEGYQLDRGFQVLLEAYPKAKEYLDYDALELQPLSSGAMLFQNGKGKLFGDPLREFSYFFPTLFSSAGSIVDKWKVFRLNKQLEKADLHALFQKEEHSSLEYLKARGFSDRIIDAFFRPFFSGIFLEPHLATSSRMFEYVYKMFGKGRAMIPKAGMGAIAQQLAGQLKHTTVHLNTEVKRVMHESIELANGDILPSLFTIIATQPDPLVNNYVSSLQWKSCDILYFTAPQRRIQPPVIGLSTEPGSLVNNIFYSTSIPTAQRGSEELLSVTVVREHNLEDSKLIEKVSQELTSIFGIDQTKLLQHKRIAQALPDLQDLQYSRDPEENQLTDRISIAGDHQLNGSFNAAMISGENAAAMAHRALSNLLFSSTTV